MAEPEGPKESPSPRAVRVGLFVTCLVDLIRPSVGFAAVKLLEDAGCTNQDILAHCRKPGEHVRGCWVVDLLLGKE